MGQVEIYDQFQCLHAQNDADFDHGPIHTTKGMSTKTADWLFIVIPPCVLNSKHAHASSG